MASSNVAALSPEWIAELNQRLASSTSPYRGTVPATIVVGVLGGPDGDRTCAITLTAGKPPTWALVHSKQQVDQADVRYDLSWEAFVDQLVGNYEPAVGYMQGTLKVKGSSRPLYELFQLWDRPEHRAVLASLAPGDP